MAVPGCCLLNFLCVLGNLSLSLSLSVRIPSLSANFSLNECFFSLTRAHSRSVMIFCLFVCLGGLISYTVISDGRELDLP